MEPTRLHANTDGYVLCPRRGEVSVEWCEGCPYRVRIEQRGDSVVVVCEAGPGALFDAWAGPLRDVPELWR